MRRFKRFNLFVALAMFVLMGTLAWLWATREDKAERFKGQVVRVYDGDTIKVAGREEEIIVRLSGIDCPERGQPFAEEAKQFVIQRAKGHMVTVKKKDTDRYGRTVGVIILPDGANLGLELVKAGLAWHYKKYSNDPELDRLEKEARDTRRGLWRDHDPLPPWEFRKRKLSISGLTPASFLTILP